MAQKIAIPVNEAGQLDAHFGHCKYFTFLTIENKAITAEEKIAPPPHEPGILPPWVAQNGATDVIAGGMGQRAIQLFNQNGVNVFVGAPQKDAKALVEDFLNESLSLSANYCDH